MRILISILIIIACTILADSWVVTSLGFIYHAIVILHIITVITVITFISIISIIGVIGVVGLDRSVAIVSTTFV